VKNPDKTGHYITNYILDARKTETAFHRLNARGQYRKISRRGGIVRSGILPGFQFRVYRNYIFPSFKEVKKELASEKKRADKAENSLATEKLRARKAEKSLASERQRAENEKQRAENEKQRAENEKQRAEKAEKSLNLERRLAERKKALEIARTMLSGGLDAAVMRCAGLSADEIAALKYDI